MEQQGNNSKSLIEQAGFRGHPGLIPTEGMSITSNSEALGVIDEMKAAINASKNNPQRGGFTIGEYNPAYIGMLGGQIKGTVDDLDEDAKKRADELNEMRKKIRDDAANSYYGQQKRHAESISKNLSMAETPKLFSNPQIINFSDAYDLKSRGRGWAKYSKYTPGINNEEREAKSMTTTEKVAKGLGKLFMKGVLVNGIGGFAAQIASAYEAVSKGTMSALYDNDFNKFLDNLNEEIDHSLKFYYTQEEKDMNFGQKLMTGSGFWNDVVGDGMSFTVGAMVSAYLSGLTLGPIGSVLGRGTRAGVWNLSKAVSQATSKVKGALSVYRNASVVPKAIGNATKIATQMYMSAGWEASVEARSFLKDMEMQYADRFESIYGRKPTGAEMSDFRAANIDAANNLFWGNTAIVGLSNAMLFGKALGFNATVFGKIPGFNHVKKFGWDKPTSSIKRFLTGVGTKTTKTGELVAANSNWLQAAIGTTWHITKRPLSEGVFEEGGQGVIRRMAEDYVNRRFDPTYLSEAVTTMDVFSNALHEQFTSKEGLMEVGMGAVIGGLFGFNRNLFGITEHWDQKKAVRQLVDAYNKDNYMTSAGLIQTLKNATSISGMMNDVSGRSEDKFAMAESLGMLDSVADDFRTTIANLDVNEMARETGKTVEEINEYKKAVLEQFETDLKNYRFANQLADVIIDDTKSEVYRSFVRHTIYKGRDAGNDVNSLIDEITKLTSGIDSDALKTYSSMSQRLRDEVERHKNLEAEVAELEREAAKVMLDTAPATPEGKHSAAVELKRRTIAVEESKQRIMQLEAELDKMAKADFSADVLQRAKENLNGREVTAKDVIEAYDAANSLMNYIKDSEREGSTQEHKNKASQLKILLARYNEALDAYNGVRLLMSSMHDSRFMNESYTGFSALLNKLFTRKRDNAGYEDTGRTKQNEKVLQNDATVNRLLSEGKIDEDQAFTLRVFNHLYDEIQPEGASDNKNRGILSEEEIANANANQDIAVPDEVADKLAERIYMRGEEGLTSDEKAIYNRAANKRIIDEKVGEKGENIVLRAKKLSENLERFIDAESPRSRNNEVIAFANEQRARDEESSLDEYINTYNELKNKQDDGEALSDEDSERLSAATNMLDSYDFGGNTSILPFVEQNRLIDRGEISVGIITNASFGSNPNDMRAYANVTEKDKDGKVIKRIDSAQNPSSLMVRRIGDAEDETFQISGMRYDRFSKFVADFVKAKLGIDVEIGKDTMFEINGKIIHIYEEAEDTHARVRISGDEGWVEELGKIGLYLTDYEGGLGYSLVYQSGETVTPVRTESTFGPSGAGYQIDEEALSMVDIGEWVTLEVDTSDDYNVRLYQEYRRVMDDSKSTDSQKESAKKKLKDNLVVLVKYNGAVISVMKADYGDGTSELGMIRSAAADEAISLMDAGNSTVAEISTDKPVVVKSIYPGTPNFNFVENADGKLSVQNKRISAEEAKHITAVGYIEVGDSGKGKAYVSKAREGFNSKGINYFPFATEVMHNSEGKYNNSRIPFVVVRNPNNGMQYVYPVALTSEDVAPSEFADMVDNWVNSSYTGTAGERTQVNNKMMELGILNTDNMVPATGTDEEVLEKMRNAARLIRDAESKPNVARWKNAESVDDIVANQVEINLNMSDPDSMFISPKISIGFGSEEEMYETGIDENFVENEDSELESLNDEAGILEKYETEVNYGLLEEPEPEVQPDSEIQPETTPEVGNNDGNPFSDIHRKLWDVVDTEVIEGVVGAREDAEPRRFGITMLEHLLTAGSIHEAVYALSDSAKGYQAYDIYNNMYKRYKELYGIEPRIERRLNNLLDAVKAANEADMAVFTRNQLIEDGGSQEDIDAQSDLIDGADRRYHEADYNFQHANDGVRLMTEDHSVDTNEEASHVAVEMLRNAGVEVITDENEIEEALPGGLVQYRIFGGNSGYVGYSISKRGAAAKRDGRFPKTEFKKEYGLSDKAFSFLLKIGAISDREWHHTSSRGNRTTFYAWSEPYYYMAYLRNKKSIDSIARSEDGSADDVYSLLDNQQLIDEYNKIDSLERERDLAIQEEEAKINSLSRDIDDLSQRISKEKDRVWHGRDARFDIEAEEGRLSSMKDDLLSLKNGLNERASEINRIYGERVNNISRENSQSGDVQFLRTSKGEVYGFTKNGKIYLDPKLMNANTPIHEYTHIWDEALRKNNPELWRRGVELMKQTPLWEQVKNDPAYADIADNEDLLASEVHARLSGEEGARLIDEMMKNSKDKSSKGIIQSLKEWINDALKWVKDAMLPWTKEEADAISLEDFARMPIRDLANGVNPNLHKSDALDDIQFRIIGEKGVSNIDAVDGAGRLNALSIAKEMLERSEDPLRIRMATGWELGRDGMWRYEVSDIDVIDSSVNYLRNEAERNYGRRRTFMMLYEIIGRDSNLFTEYPSLKNVKVAVEPKDKIRISASYNNIDGGVISITNGAITGADGINLRAEAYRRADESVIRIGMGINPYTKKKFTVDDDIEAIIKEVKNNEIEALNGLREAELSANSIFLNILIHEIQHAIQEIEGFTVGGSPDLVRLTDEYKIENKIFIEKFDDLKNKLSDNKIDIQSIRDSIKRKEEVASAIRDKISLLDGQISVMDKTQYPDSEVINMLDRRQEIIERIAELEIDIKNVLRFNSIERDVIEHDRLENMLNNEASAAYFRLYGEIEARNATRRRDYSEEKRRSTLLSESEKEDRINPDRAIIVMANNVMRKANFVMQEKSKNDNKNCSI